jgi:glycerol-3-phosphate dehydrogenase
MWPTGWRAALPDWAQEEWDCIIVGGGITGAGILLEAVKRGWKVLLLEQRDFAWGTSSRSSKLVHGGLRYLKQGKFGLTFESVRERQSLLREAAGLVEPQGFVLADMAGRKPGRWIYSIGLAVYDTMAGQHTSRYLKPDDLLMLAPHIERKGLKGGLSYQDAKTDDARLVMRVLQEALAHGAHACNYVEVRKVLREGAAEAAAATNGQAGQAGQAGQPESVKSAGTAGRVCGVEAFDLVSGRTITLRAKMVISATGAWADGLRPQGAGRIPQKIRPLRGSHLLFPAWRFPVSQAVSLMHPADGRPVFAYPWEGVTLVGTTDVDHSANLQQEATITAAEVDYILAAVTFQFPELKLTQDDILATYAGVRPVIDSGKADPSQEGRDHVVWQEQGLLTVTGGKLTTFRPIAQDALRHAARYLPQLPSAAQHAKDAPIFAENAPLSQQFGLPAMTAQRLQGRYGVHATSLLAAAQQGETALIPGTQTLWAELRWAARMEAVVHLEDLLLRRTRLGLQLAGGGVACLDKIRGICQSELGWSDGDWAREQQAYLDLWQKHYSVPGRHSVAEGTAGTAGTA